MLTLSVLELATAPTKATVAMAIEVTDCDFAHIQERYAPASLPRSGRSGFGTRSKPSLTTRRHGALLEQSKDDIAAIQNRH